MLLTIIKKHENVFFSCKLSLKNYLPQNEDTGLDRLIIEFFFTSGTCMSKTRRWDKYTTKSILLSFITLETGHPCVKLLTFQSQWSQLLWSLKVRFICLSVCLSVDLEAKIMVPGLLWPGLNSLTFRWPSTSVKQTIRINWLRFNIISGLICLLHWHSCSNNVVLNALATQMWIYRM